MHWAAKMVENDVEDSVMRDVELPMRKQRQRLEAGADLYDEDSVMRDVEHDEDSVMRDVEHDESAGWLSRAGSAFARFGSSTAQNIRNAAIIQICCILCACFGVLHRRSLRCSTRY